MARQPTSDAMARPGPPTAHDVARLAGVSQSAVSRSFTPGASVSEKTRQKVLKTAKELGYRPNLIARSLITQRSNLIGVAIPHLDNPFYATLLEALSEDLAEHGYRAMLFPAPMSAFVDPLIEEMLSFRLGGLILVSSSLSSGLAEECLRIGLPVVQVNRVSSRGTVSSIVGDNRGGAAQVAEFLVAGGHERIAYMAGLEASSTNHDREEGFTGQLARHGRSLSHRVVANYSAEQARDLARLLLARPDRPDALFCANDHMAIAALSVARAEFGLVPGRDISIVGFDDTRLSAMPEFSLTTFRQPVIEMARDAADVLHRMISAPDAEATRTVLPGELVIRGSARLPD
ncbi:LacI family DNA-binding transcriptional regulator [Paenirhodobacter populi]|nr:LacI family DNA-binding transcriptional regulator [Sinirhodobacter populi]